MYSCVGSRTYDGSALPAAATGAGFGLLSPEDAKYEIPPVRPIVPLCIY